MLSVLPCFASVRWPSSEWETDIGSQLPTITDPIFSSLFFLLAVVSPLFTCTILYYIYYMCSTCWGFPSKHCHKVQKKAKTAHKFVNPGWRLGIFPAWPINFFHILGGCRSIANKRKALGFAAQEGRGQYRIKRSCHPNRGVRRDEAHKIGDNMLRFHKYSRQTRDFYRVWSEYCRYVKKVEG